MGTEYRRLIFMWNEFLFTSSIVFLKGESTVGDVDAASSCFAI